MERRCAPGSCSALLGGGFGVNSSPEGPVRRSALGLPLNRLGRPIVSIVPCNRIRKEHVLDLGSPADIVHDEGALPVWRFLLCDDSDMRKIACDYPNNEISRRVVFCLGRNRENDALAGEEGLKIQNSPMVDVRVGSTETPVVRKRVKMGPHFFVDILLEIDPEFTIGPDDEVRADTNVARGITVGVGD